MVRNEMFYAYFQLTYIMFYKEGFETVAKRKERLHKLLLLNYMTKFNLKVTVWIKRVCLSTDLCLFKSQHLKYWPRNTLRAVAAVNLIK